MKIKWLVADVIAVVSLDRAKHAILGVIVAGCVFANPGRCCGRKATLWCRNPLLSSNTFTKGHLMKIEWLVTDVTAIESSDRAEHAIFEVIVTGRAFGQSRSLLWSGSHFVV